MIRFGFALALGTAAMLALGCSSYNPLNPSTTTLTEANNGNTISLPVGTAVRVVLQSNQTTGYQWQLAPGLNQNVLQYVSNTYVPSAAAAGLAGAGGVEVWNFQVIGQGNTQLQMQYAQPWVGGGVGTTFAVVVNGL